MAVLNDIAAKLATLSLGTVGVDIHIGTMPETPDVCCAVYEYPGAPADLGFGVTSKVKYEYPRVQVQFRGAPDDYATPRAQAESARNGLAQVQGTQLNSVNYLLIYPVNSSPFPLKDDTMGRKYFACNFEVTKEPS